MAYDVKVHMKSGTSHQFNKVDKVNERANGDVELVMLKNTGVAGIRKRVLISHYGYTFIEVE